MARGTVMFVGSLGAKKVGGTRGSPKKDVRFEGGLFEGPVAELWVADKKDVSGV